MIEYLTPENIANTLLYIYYFVSGSGSREMSLFSFIK